MPNLNVKHKVRLTPQQRQDLETLCRQQSMGAAKYRRARILLLSDEDHPQGRRRDWEIAETLGMSERQVVRVRQAFVREGESAIERQAYPPRELKLDGPAEAQLVTLCCSTPPQGRERWTLQLLCDELARLQVVTSVCRETVRQHLKKTNSNPGRQNGSASPKQTAHGSLLAWKKSSTSINSPAMSGSP